MQARPFTAGSHSWLCALAIAAVPITAPRAGADDTQPKRPNILVVMADDQGYWDTGATGNPHIDTPRIDSLAAAGTRFNRYYAAPVCAPTRAGMMTGRYYLRTGLYNTRFGGDSMGLGEITVGQLLQSAGYRTGLFGKWHLGKYAEYQPQARGFDAFLGHYHGHIERYEHPDQIHHNGRPVDARGYVTDLFTDAAIDFISSACEKPDDTAEPAPFFCALMYNAPHSPFLLDTTHAHQADGDALIQKYLQRGLPMREARIYGMIERIDQNVGRLLGVLDELDIADQTLVIYTSDNGGVSRFWKGGMNGQKASPYEGGVRAPMFVRWPGQVPAGGSVDAQVSHVDLLPTLCQLAGAELPDDRAIDGKSWGQLLQQGSGDQHHRYVYHTWDRYVPNPDRRWGISDQRWKLLGLFGQNAAPDPQRWRLFDLENDPGETTNLAGEHPKIVERLRAEFVRWFDEVTAGVDYTPIPIPVGHRSENPVSIEPSWGDWRGANIEYVFDGYDWDTIQGWRQPGERVSWKLDVRQAGTYQVWLQYGCRPGGAGGRLKLSAADTVLTHRVEATATADQFDQRLVGEMHLDAGPAALVAEVVDTPGDELMRLRAVRLERIEVP